MEDRWFVDENRLDMVGRWRLNGLLRTMRRFDFILDNEVMPINDYDYSLDPETGMIYGESHVIGVWISVWSTKGDWYSDERLWERRDIC